MNIKKIKLTALVITTIGLFSGCSSISINKNLVKNYKSPVSISSNEALVYVIRESAFGGAGRGLWVAHNDKVIANIGSGEYSYFKVKKGINTINTVQAKKGSGYMSIDKLSKKPIFFKYNYTEGKMEKISYELGVSYVANYDKVDLLSSPKVNDGYEDGVFNLSLFKDLKIMEKSDKILLPDAKHSVITFVFPWNSSDISSTIWADNGIVGNLKPNQYIQIKVPKGKHKFYIKSTADIVLEANIDAAKHYRVEIDKTEYLTGSFFSLAPLVKFVPINLSKDFKNLNSSLEQVQVKKNLDSNVNQRINFALAEIKKKKLTKEVSSVLKKEFGKK